MVMGSLKQEAEVVVIGGGPGGYTAAIRAADLGKEVVLIEERDRMGGVCLTEGCIPSKTLINAVAIALDARKAQDMGVLFDGIRLDENQLRKWTQTVVSELSSGISSLLKGRGVEKIKGRARFDSDRSVIIEGGEVSGVEFKQCIIATGSRINEIPAAYNLPVWSSAEALKIPSIPEKLVVVGGGYIGLEMGLVYAGLGSKVSMVEFFPRLLTCADPDLVDVVVKSCEKRFKEILTDSRVTGMVKTENGFSVTIDHNNKKRILDADRVLVAVGRKPNTGDLGLENTKVVVNDKGVIETDDKCRTAQENIFAVGDVTKGPMLAHKAAREAKVAAEAIAGEPSAFDNRVVPAVIFTDPEIAWVGLTELAAKDRGRKVKVGKFPLKALGKARAINRTEGFVKVLSDPDSKLVLGMSIVGHKASELIAEGALAIEMGATLEDLLVTIHPHPTLSEAVMEAAEAAMGSSVHIARKRG